MRSHLLRYNVDVDSDAESDTGSAETAAVGEDSQEVSNDSKWAILIIFFRCTDIPAIESKCIFNFQTIVKFYLYFINFDFGYEPGNFLQTVFIVLSE